MDAEAIAQKEAEELMKERRELQARLKSQEKKVLRIYNCNLHVFMLYFIVYIILKFNINNILFCSFQG